MKKRAVGYYRTSSATGVGDDKDSLSRQQNAVRNYALRNDLEIVREEYDAAVRGSDMVMDRPGFSALVQYALANKIDTILVESPHRFARDLIVQITGHDFLKKSLIDLIPVDIPDFFTEDTPTAIMVRQILGAVFQFQKNSLVEMMAKGRLKKRAQTGRCEGRKPPPPEAVAYAKELKGMGLSLRVIADRMKDAGYTVIVKGKKTDRPYPAASVKYMIENLGENDVRVDQ